MQEILFVKTSSLGDVVHNMPAVTDVARAFPKARLSWVVEEAFAPLARLHPAISEIITVATRQWRTQVHRPQTWRQIAAARAQLGATDYDCVIDTQGLLRSALIGRLAHGTHHGYDFRSIREPVASLFYDIRHSVPRTLHAVARNRALCARALGYAEPDGCDYGLLPAPESASQTVLLLHGTSRAAKEWSEENWRALGDWLQRRGFEVLLPCGSKDERARSERLAEGIAHSRVIDRQPLDYVARLVAGAAIVIGVDTGLLHLAAAYRTPLLGIYCATDPALTGPLGNGPIQVVGNGSGPPTLEQVIDAAVQLLI